MTNRHPIDQGITWSIPQMYNLRFMRAQYVQHAFKPHAHDYYVLGIIEAGLQSFTYKPFTHKREEIITSPGHLILINPGEIHTGEAAIKHGFTYRALYPTIDLMDMITREFNIKNKVNPTFRGGITYDRELFQRALNLHRLSENPITVLELEERLTQFFVDLIQRHADDVFTVRDYKTVHQAIHQVRDYLEAHYADNISLSDLSQLTHISPYHLARMFRRYTGIPPHKYLENVRIRQAERLLGQEMPIVDTAMATGFSSQSHLTRTFKKFIGTTPGEFVKQRKIV